MKERWVEPTKSHKNIFSVWLGPTKSHLRKIFMTGAPKSYLNGFFLASTHQVTPSKSIYDRDPKKSDLNEFLMTWDPPSRIGLKLCMTWTHQVTSEIMNYGLHNHMWDPPSHTPSKNLWQGPKNHIWMFFNSLNPPSHTFEKYFWQGPQKSDLNELLMTWTHQVAPDWNYSWLGPTKSHLK